MGKLITNTLLGEDTMIQLPWKIVWQFHIKLNIQQPYHPAIVLLGTYPRKKKKKSSSKNLHVDVSSSFIHKSPKPKTAQLSSNRWMAEQTVVCPCRGTLCNNKREWTVDIWRNLDVSLGNYAQMSILRRKGPHVWMGLGRLDRRLQWQWQSSLSQVWSSIHD